MTPALILLAWGCASERFGVHGSECDGRFWRFSDDLTAHLMAGDRRSGTWDYDPAGRVESRNRGRYDFQTGEFSWQIAYDPDHYRVISQVEGYGYAAPNGDLDVAFTVSTRFIDDDERAWTVRERREGCELRRRVEGVGGVELLEGVFGRSVFSWTRVALGVVYSGQRARAGDWIEQGSGVGYESEATGDGDGYSIDRWREEDGEDLYEGVTERFLDGSQHVSYTHTWPDGSLRWDYTVDFFGDGEGSVEGEGLTCALSFDGGVCAYDCGGGEAGRC